MLGGNRCFVRDKYCYGITGGVMRRKSEKPSFGSVAGLCVGVGVFMLSGINAFAADTGWKYESNIWRYYEADKGLHLGWLNTGSDWYYLEPLNGNMKTGWFKYSDGKWYFLNTNPGSAFGSMLKGWQWIDGYCYYFDTVSGRMFESETTADGYQVDAMGRCLDSTGKTLFERGKGILTKQENTGFRAVSGMSGGGRGAGGSGRGGAGGGRSGSGKGDSSGSGGGSGNIGNAGKGSPENGKAEDENGDRASEKQDRETEAEIKKIPKPGDKPEIRKETETATGSQIPGKNEATEEDKKTEDKKAEEDKGTEDKKGEDDSTVKPPEEKKPEAERSDEEKAEKVYEELTKGSNDNVVQFKADDGKIHTIIWVQGITAPEMGEGGDFKKEVLEQGNDRYVDYIAEYAPGNSWFDVNKSDIGSAENARDRNLCFAAAASNMLHWWMEQNKEYIEEYEQRGINLTREIKGRSYRLEHLKDSFASQSESGVFELFKDLYGNNENGFYADLLVDLFINGYTPKAGGGSNLKKEDLTPDSRAGFFHEVFGGELLTNRTYRGGYRDFGDSLKEMLGAGDIVAVSHTVVNNYNHVVTLWGAEYDLDGNIAAIYVTDSDDREDEEIGMKRYGVRNANGMAKLSTNVSNKNHGSNVGNLYTLSLGRERWKEYLGK